MPKTTSKESAVFCFAWPVYPIVDCDTAPGGDPLGLARSLAEAGAPLLQLRAKSLDTRGLVDLALEMAALCEQYGTRLIVNDRADVAEVVHAAGVHLGQEDLPPAVVRRWFSPPRIIGYSTHNLTQALAAARSGSVDYIGVGPIFSTTTKANPDPVVGLQGLREIRAAVAIPIVAIGGITEANAQAVLDAGADAVAMIRAIARAENPGQFVRGLAEHLARKSHATEG
ncbi:MAG: thiamine-phosphate synthase [Candidatus Binatia bacterium]|nr:MAG: thiamine-phosphate synthase [Candidatus Binatia bacterium]